MIRYVVHEENTLGIVRDESLPFVWLEPLASNVNGRNPKNGPTVVNRDEYRDATLEDFDTFRVCARGHILPL
ncbi:hypothetical protein [Rhizobium phage RHEph12]|nr:hypothetical protein [Rhizobium phage RHEph12]